MVSYMLINVVMGVAAYHRPRARANARRWSVSAPNERARWLIVLLLTNNNVCTCIKEAAHNYDFHLELLLPEINTFRTTKNQLDSFARRHSQEAPPHLTDLPSC